MIYQWTGEISKCGKFELFPSPAKNINPEEVMLPKTENCELCPFRKNQGWKWTNAPPNDHVSKCFSQLTICTEMKAAKLGYLFY